MVVTGREGQIVRSLVERAEGSPFEVVPLGRPEIDLAGPPNPILQVLESARPDIVVSAAAYTQVDKAESEPGLAFAVNADGAGAVARAAHALGVPLIHLSTDYVFDGSNPSPYVEEDPPRPASVYGASKLAGEGAVLSTHEDCAVLRTAWVYSPFGANFVRTMLRLASDRDEIAVVADQRGNPTSALDLADAILAIAANLCTRSEPSHRGVFHVVGQGDASWAELAQAIFAASAAAGGPSAQVKPIATADYPTAATRPANSRLDSGKLARIHDVRLPHWKNALEQVVTRLAQAGA